MKRYALIGDPIDKSPSPALHNAGFAALGIDAHYELRPTTAAQAPELMQELLAGKWQGLNVTTPLKVAMASHVQLQGGALRAQAVNTLWQESTTWMGALTDIDGILHPLQRAHAPDAANAVIIGSGGASRAAVLALEQLGSTIHMVARRKEQASVLLDELRVTRQGRIAELDDLDAIRKIFKDVDLVIQATPVGRAGDMHNLPWDVVHKPCIAFDMLYFPRRTPFLQQAEAQGAQCIEGWQMLLDQGIAAFEMWTKQKAPRQVMQDAILGHLAALEGRE